ncbi:NAD(P)-dependent dehydrogenase (short-subunit alcohol dehydrogenase family) [Haloferula luteola]|uniref:NAD(P)-dependent dehydrogenase (Short-subunit alcohol dehydrogenase family) n=1 Tax=Haloferula luteola TaxID=595692 RepID=A0A840VG03_9BACT|nr:SDR family oxidoreductase [Haloferula luteola]MBB5352749.1 NAD(P)-dependent dehydrogenase (short-subunit alcohol dehydrogenase family) [Haloferula luteola]
MSLPSPASLFDISGKVIIVTGASGALTGCAADYLATQGARVVYLGRSQEKLDACLERIRQQHPGAEVMATAADIADRAALEAARDAILARWGRIDALLNGAGGNQAGATITPDKTFADLDFEAFQQVVDLNLHGTVLPSLVFTPALLESGSASIVNYSSASSAQAITRVVGYSAAKAAVDNFTRWLAVDLGRRTRGTVRVNALVPGFFLAEQNRKLLTQEDGTFTERGRTICEQTPFGRFGEPEELNGALHYLVSEASRFVTGTTLVVDGGFAAFSGV